MGVFSLRLISDSGNSFSSQSEDPGSSKSQLQNPEWVHGTVHMPAIIAYMLYKQAWSIEQLAHHQPLLQQWVGQLPSLLMQSTTKEYKIPEAAVLRLDFFRVIETRAVVFLGEVLPLQVCSR